MNLWKLHILDLAWSYFRESKAYDLKRGIDTHRRVPLSAYGMVGADLAGANLYMAAWTSVIRDSFMELLHCRDGGLEDFDCIDAGCGKGKVLLVWKELLREQGLGNAVSGIELSRTLLDVCRANLDRLACEDVQLLCSNVLDVDYSSFSGKLLVYLYNPFGGEVMEAFLEKLADKEVLVVYNNPVHLDVFIRAGFSLLVSKQGRYPVMSYAILHRM